MVPCVTAELDPTASPLDLAQVLRFYTLRGFKRHLAWNPAFEKNRKN
jgi:hypothetical protein